MKKIFVGIFVAVVSTFVACDDDLNMTWIQSMITSPILNFYGKSLIRSIVSSTIRRIRLRIGMLSMMNI